MALKDMFSNLKNMDSSKDVKLPGETFLRKLSFNRAIRQETWRMLGDLTGTGMELHKALDLVGKTFAKRSSSVTKIMDELKHSLETDDFVPVLRKYIPESEVLIFSKFGSASDVSLFNAAARIVKVEAAIQKAITSAIVKPAIIMLMIVTLLYLLGSEFYPSLVLIAPLEKWPFSWRIIGRSAFWVAANPIWLGVIMVSIYTFYKYLQLNYIGRLRPILDKIPPFSLYRTKNGATFTFVIIENAAVGNSINPNLMRVLSRNVSRYTKSRIMAIEKEMSKLENIGSSAIAAGQNFPDPEINVVLEAYAGQKNWVENFRRYADTWLERLEGKVKSIMAILNFLLMIVAAIFIAIIGQTMFGIINLVQT